MRKLFCKIICACLLAMTFSSNVKAKEVDSIGVQAYDVEIVNNTNTQNFTRKAVSSNPTIAMDSMPQNISTVSFSITSQTYIRYNRVSGKYVSTQNPKVSLSYSGPVNLSISQCDASYTDCGKYIEYRYKLKIKGTVTANTGMYVEIEYNDVSYSYRVYK